MADKKTAKVAFIRAVNTIKRVMTKANVPITTAERHRDNLINAYKHIQTVHDEYVDSSGEPMEKVLQAKEA